MLLIAVSAAFVASAWVLWLTRAPGPGLSPDSMSYLGAAQELGSGRAPRVPFTDWSDEDSTARLSDYPPGFPTAIAAVGSRAVLVMSGGATVGIATLVVGSVAGPAAGLIAAALLLVTPAFIEDHSIVLSEPLYLAFMAMVLALMAMDDPPILLLGVAAAAGVMVRYAGLSLAGAVALYCMVEPRPLAARLRRASIGAGPAVLAFLAWNHWAGGARAYGWKPGFLATLAEGAGTAQAWLAPSLAPGVLRVAIALAVAAACVALMIRASSDPSEPGVRRLLRACGLLALCFAGLMVFSRLYADGAIIFDNRLLSPLIVTGTVAAVAAGGTRWKTWSRRHRALAVLALAAWAFGSARLAGVQVRELNEDGWGFASRDWQSNDLADWLRGDGRGYALFSDNTPATYSLTGRPSRHVPDTIDDSTTAQFGDVLAVSPSAIVSFTDAYAPDHPRGEAFANKLGMVEVLRSDEGTVWIRPGPSAHQPEHDAGDKH